MTWRASAVLFGGGGLLLFGIFLFRGGFGLVGLGFKGSCILLFDAGLSLAFFVQHSAMVRRPVRAWLARCVQEDYVESLYAVSSGVVLIPVVLLWQSGSPVFSPPPPWSLLFRIVFLLGLTGFLWGVFSLRSVDLLGTRSTGAHQPLVIAGPYRFVRHPLYSFTILMIWSSPYLTSDRLLFNVLWTVWIFVGAHLEERDLLADFGAAYREYSRKVPMFLPSFRHS